MRWPAVIALVLVTSGCGSKHEQLPANQQTATEKTAETEANLSANAQQEPATENAQANVFGTLPPSNAALRYVGRWATNHANCASKPWVFTKDELAATGGPHCTIYDVKTVPGGYDLAVQCPAKKPDPTDLIKLRFAESARAMLVESNAIEPMGLIYCGE